MLASIIAGCDEILRDRISSLRIEQLADSVTMRAIHSAWTNDPALAMDLPVGVTASAREKIPDAHWSVAPMERGDIESEIQRIQVSGFLGNLDVARFERDETPTAWVIKTHAGSDEERAAWVMKCI